MRTCSACSVAKPLDEFWRQCATCKTCRAAYMRSWVARKRQETGNAKFGNGKYDRKKWRAYNIKKLYGITIGEYESMLALQGDGCAVCRAREPGGRGKFFHVDHDHATGRVRGLLCHGCNIGIGNLGDSVDGAEKAARYLRGSKFEPGISAGLL